MQGARRIAGVVALVTYLVMGAMIYFTVMPGADGHWPPDFHLRGYDATSIGPFLQALSDEARATYGAVLTFWDRIFIVALASWIALTGWRGGGLRFFVAGLAVLYAAIDLAENAAIHGFVMVVEPTAEAVRTAHYWTMAKFASLYLCVLVLVVHLRRNA